MSSETLFARRLNEAFDKVRKPDGSQYSNQELAEAIGGGTTAGHIWKLRNGQVQNPKYTMIKAIIDFFDIDPAHFFWEDDKLTADKDPAVTDLAKALTDPDTQRIARRANQKLSSAAQRKIVLHLIDALDQVTREEAARLQPSPQP